jgi:hypothetical protein
MTFYEFIRIDFLMQRIMNNYCATEFEGRRLLKRTGIKLMKTRLVLVPKSHLGTRTNAATRLNADQENGAIIFSSPMG